MKSKAEMVKRFEQIVENHENARNRVDRLIAVSQANLMVDLLGFEDIPKDLMNRMSVSIYKDLTRNFLGVK